MLRRLASLMLIGLGFSGAVATAENYTVKEEDFQNLARVRESIKEMIGAVQADFNDIDVIPRERDRKQFRAAMEKLQLELASERGIDGWVNQVKQQPVVPPLTPTISKKDISGHFVVGGKNTENQSEASRTWSAACDELSKQLKDLLGSAFDSFQCGSPSNISRYKSIGYYQFSSRPVLKIRVDSSWQLSENEVGAVVGDKVSTENADEAYAKWKVACFQWMKRQKEEYGDRFVAAACGDPKNIAQYASIGYIEYQSTGLVTLRD